MFLKRFIIQEVVLLKSVWLSLADGCEMDPKRNYQDVKPRRVTLFIALFLDFFLI